MLERLVYVHGASTKVNVNVFGAHLLGDYF